MAAEGRHVCDGTCSVVGQMDNGEDDTTGVVRSSGLRCVLSPFQTIVAVLHTERQPGFWAVLDVVSLSTKSSSPVAAFGRR